jgi:hypothetical protein
MALPIIEAEPPLGFFDPARDAILRNYNIAPPPPQQGLKIVYIDRQSTDRRLTDETHLQLLETCREFVVDGKAVFDHIILEEFTVPQQIEAVAYADVVFLSAIVLHKANAADHDWYTWQRTNS